MKTREGKKPYEEMSNFEKFVEKTSNINHTFGNVTQISRVKEGVALNPGSPLIRAYGCATCDWKGTNMCPFRTDEDFIRRGQHVNGYCSNRILYMKDVVLSLRKGLAPTKQAEQFIRNDSLLQVYRQELMEAKENGDSEAEDAAFKKLMELEKLNNDILTKFRKQEEGSKLSVEKKVTPADIAKLMRSADVVEVQAEEDDEE